MSDPNIAARVIRFTPASDRSSAGQPAISSLQRLTTSKNRKAPGQSRSPSPTPAGSCITAAAPDQRGGPPPLLPSANAPTTQTGLKVLARPADTQPTTAHQGGFRVSRAAATAGPGAVTD